VAIAQTERRDLDSIILENGQSPFSVLPPDVVAVRRKLVSEQGQGVFIPPPPPTSFGIPENHPSADWVKRHLTPHPVSTFDSPPKSPIRSSVGSASSSATPTGRRAPTSISRTSRGGAQRLTCSPATRRGASRPISRSCRIYYAGNHRMPDERQSLPFPGRAGMKARYLTPDRARSGCSMGWRMALLSVAFRRI
jgi:hypothetical protein